MRRRRKLLFESIQMREAAFRKQGEQGDSLLLHLNRSQGRSSVLSKRNMYLFLGRWRIVDIGQAKSSGRGGDPHDAMGSL